MDFKTKYLKYKNKYLELKNGMNKVKGAGYDKWSTPEERRRNNIAQLNNEIDIMITRIDFNLRQSPDDLLNNIREILRKVRSYNIT